LKPSKARSPQSVGKRLTLGYVRVVSGSSHPTLGLSIAWRCAKSGMSPDLSRAVTRSTVLTYCLCIPSDGDVRRAAFVRKGQRSLADWLLKSKGVALIHQWWYERKPNHYPLCWLLTYPAKRLLASARSRWPILPTSWHASERRQEIMGTMDFAMRSKGVNLLLTNRLGGASSRA